MTTYIVTRKSDKVEVYRYSAEQAIEWSGMEFTTHDHTPEAVAVIKAVAVAPHVWSPIEFLRRFTAAERIRIRTAAKQSPALDDFMFLLEAANEVRSDHLDVQSGLSMLEAAGLIGAGRAQEILS